jgi:hypothetical protein
MRDNDKKVNFIVDFGGVAAKINNKNYLSRTHVEYVNATLVEIFQKLKAIKVV